MCGIIGVLSTIKNWHVKSILYDGLLELQNRGYDSMGIALLDEQGFRIEKSISKDKVLKFLTDDTHNIQNGIAHTRWATHGNVTTENAHPHVDTLKNEISVVHNGIIENYQELKTRLLQKHFVFRSTTDTEVIVNLIAETFYESFRHIDDIVERMALSIDCVTTDLEGTYGIIVQHVSLPTYLFCARRGSPILIGINTEQTIGIITSEKSAFPHNVNDYIALQDNSLYVLTCQFTKVHIRAFRGTDEKRTYRSDSLQLEKNMSMTGFRCFTEKEIWEQPIAVQKALNFGSRLQYNSIRLGGLDRITSQLEECQNVYLFGCGTSFHSALIGAHFFRECSGLNVVQAYNASEFDVRELPRVPGRSCCVFISQSGETLDLYILLEKLRQADHNFVMLGVINVVDSLIARTVDAGVYMNCGRERGVASSKSFTSSVIVLWLVSRWFYRCHIDQDEAHDVLNVSEHIEQLFATIHPTVISWVGSLSSISSILLLGKHFDFHVAQEGSLKIKELSYVHAEAYPCGALKHGPFALLHSGMLVFFIATVKEGYSKSLNALNEVLAREARVILLCCQSFHDLMTDTQHDQLDICILPDTPWAFLLANIVLQIFALELAIHLGHNPDFPRNLAKVVTVE